MGTTAFSFSVLVVEPVIRELPNGIAGKLVSPVGVPFGRHLNLGCLQNLVSSSVNVWS